MPSASPAGQQRYLTRRALCERLAISRATSYRLERLGYLPKPVRLGPRTARWPLAEVEAFERCAAEDRGSQEGAAAKAAPAAPEGASPNAIRKADRPARCDGAAPAEREGDES